MLVPYADLASAFDADKLLSDALQISGLSDFGDERFIFALRRMTECYIQDVQVDHQGLRLVCGTIVRQLVNRARFEADLKAHPEIRDEDVSDPIVILGMPRSGK